MPPYLLFYLVNGDDIPDGDPGTPRRVRSGSTHSGANSALGPGRLDLRHTWQHLYRGDSGHQVSRPGRVAISSAHQVRGVRRRRRRTFCIDFDSQGQLFSGTNHGNTRGVHYPQGSCFTKNWGKHGPLINPYAFGYYQHMAHEGYKPRFAQSMIIWEAVPSPNTKAISSPAWHW